MPKNIRIERLNHAFLEEISKILMEEIKDEDLKFITITEVNVTNDLSYAKVYFTVLEEERRKEVEKSLNNAASFIRGKLSERIEIRHTPELRFIYDESGDYGERIDNILNKLKENK